MSKGVRESALMFCVPAIPSIENTRLATAPCASGFGYSGWVLWDEVSRLGIRTQGLQILKEQALMYGRETDNAAIGVRT